MPEPISASLLASAWTAVSAAVQAYGFLPPPPLDTQVWTEVARGGTARRRESSSGVDRAVGITLFQASRAESWLAITDDNPPDKVSGLFELALSGSWASPKVLYQRIDMPWPIQDRHWAISLSNNTQLASHADIWERAWDRAPSAMTQAHSRVGESAWTADGGAIETPVNQGSWLLLPVQDQTLVIYQTRASLGGSVPDGAVEDWAYANLQDVLNKTESNARQIRNRYQAGCTQQPGGDGKQIPCMGG